MRLKIVPAIMSLYPIALICPAQRPEGSSVTLPLRCRVQPFKGSETWDAVSIKDNFALRRSAIIICDMWDRHWCGNASARVGELAMRMDPLLRKARGAGVLVIHAPSDTMQFYKDYPQHQVVLAAPKAAPPTEMKIIDPPLPIDDSDGGCENPNDHEHIVWTHENAALSLDATDAISDNGREIYNLLQQRGIQNLFVMGVHTNMCILNRGFAIRQMTRWRIRCVLVRDLTDSMYNPKRRPFVEHAAGTDLVIEHIEKYWCPTVLSADLMAAFEKN